ncbi:MAG: cyclic lactone autoinducer peptide [Lachnospiraceae bacterium]|nr:cyclic lactone autoinducer peptide [Lachnospiraceae bacterium]
MKKDATKRIIAKGVASILSVTLHAEANSTSCMIIYQPKAPKELSKYRRAK